VSTGRAVPFYCPYCGEEELVPDVPEGATGEGHGHWACRACRRSFRLSLTALASPTAVASPTAIARPTTTSAPGTATALANGTTPSTKGTTAPEENG